MVDHNGQPGGLVFDLDKLSPFSFKCQVCGACCYNKAIQIAPYEALRLSRNLGTTTSKFYHTCTEEGGPVLRNKADGSCIFLDPRGCGIYPDRPLLCRLFPLGQIVDKEGRERFGSMPLHPDCLGLLGAEGTVESYLESQELASYFHYDKIYSAIYKSMLKKLSPMAQPAGKAIVPKSGHMPDGRSPSPGNLITSWLDIDATVERYCQDKELREPSDLEKRLRLHIAAIEEWLGAL